MTQFHSDEYIEFLRLITPDNQHEHMRQLKRFNVAEDCPVFDGLFNFTQIKMGMLKKNLCDFDGRVTHSCPEYSVKVQPGPRLGRPHDPSN